MKSMNALRAYICLPAHCSPKPQNETPAILHTVWPIRTDLNSESNNALCWAVGHVAPFSIPRSALDCSKSWKEWSMLKWQTALQHSMLREVGAAHSTQSTLPLQTRSRLLTEEPVRAYLYLQKTAALVTHMKCPWMGMSKLSICRRGLGTRTETWTQRFQELIMCGSI